jgi:hypothetical protein
MVYYNDCKWKVHDNDKMFFCRYHGLYGLTKCYCINYKKKKEKEHPLVLAMKQIIKKEEEETMRNFKFSGF